MHNVYNKLVDRALIDGPRRALETKAKVLVAITQPIQQITHVEMT